MMCVYTQQHFQQEMLLVSTVSAGRQLSIKPSRLIRQRTVPRSSHTGRLMPRAPVRIEAAMATLSAGRVLPVRPFWCRERAGRFLRIGITLITPLNVSEREETARPVSVTALPGLAAAAAHMPKSRTYPFQAVFLMLSLLEVLKTIVISTASPPPQLH